jgi:hypothetical protein
MEEIREIELTNFEPDNEPTLRFFADGSMCLVMNLFPPYAWLMSERDESKFDEDLSEWIGVTVNWEDREFFSIPSPQADTEEKVKEFIRTYRERKGYLVNDGLDEDDE